MMFYFHAFRAKTAFLCHFSIFFVNNFFLKRTAIISFSVKSFLMLIVSPIAVVLIKLLKEHSVARCKLNFSILINCLPKQLK